MRPLRPKALPLETFDAPVKVLEREAEPRCPKCHAAFERLRLGELEIERCTECQGLWFDVLEWQEAARPELAAHLDTGSAEVGRQHDADADLYCPNCETTPLTRLELAHHPGLHVDKCPRCYGAFFDAGELRSSLPSSLGARLRALFNQ